MTFLPLVLAFLALALVASVVSARFPGGRPSLGFLFPVLEGAQGVAQKAFTTQIPAGQMDALLLDLRNIDVAATDEEIQAFLDQVLVKMTFTSSGGDSPVNIDDVPAGFFADYARRRGGFYDPQDGIIIDTTRYNLTGEEEVNLRLTWLGADVAPLGAACEVQAHRAYRMIDKPDGSHMVYRARPLSAGNGLKYTVTADNVSEIFLWDADVDKITVHVEGKAYALDADLMQTLTHYESNAIENTRLVQVYAAGLLEQYSADTIQFVIDSNSAQGYFVEIGSKPDPVSAARSTAVVKSKQAVKLQKIERDNPGAAVVLQSAGVKPSRVLMAEAEAVGQASSSASFGVAKPAKFSRAAKIAR